MEETKEIKPIEMLIKLHPENGNVSVTCSMLHDKVLCYGILESAKFAIVQSQLKAQPKVIIQPAKGGIVNFMRNKK